jgi:hypothetical protein
MVSAITNSLSQHQQIDPMSCIPMSVELVLKFLGKVRPDWTELQKEWQNDSSGNFSKFHQRVVNGVTFFKPAGFDNRGPQFPLDRLFATIDSELAEGRYVIISLAEAGGWHMYVIVKKGIDGDYIGVTRWHGQAQAGTATNVKQRVRDMQGTDILTYTV